MTVRSKKIVHSLEKSAKGADRVTGIQRKEFLTKEWRTQKLSAMNLKTIFKIFILINTDRILHPCFAQTTNSVSITTLRTRSTSLGKQFKLKIEKSAKQDKSHLAVYLHERHDDIDQCYDLSDDLQHEPGNLPCVSCFQQIAGIVQCSPIRGWIHHWVNLTINRNLGVKRNLSKGTRWCKD